MSRFAAASVALLFLSACGPPPCPPLFPCFSDPPPVRTLPVEEPSPQIVTVSPSPAALDVFTGAPIWARFDVAPSRVDITVRSGGEILQGTSEIDESGRRVVFTPLEGLPRSSAVEVELAWESPESPASWAFDTGAWGDPLDDPTDLVGAVQRLDLGTAARHRGLAAMFAAMHGEKGLLLGIAEDSALEIGALQLDVVTADEDGFQEPCVPVSRVTDPEAPGLWLDPTASLRGVDVPMPLAGSGDHYTLQDADLDWTVHPDGDSIAGATLTGVLDAREIDPLLTNEDDDEEGVLCDLVRKTVGVECFDCPDGSGPFCMDLELSGMTGARVDIAIEPMECD